MLRNAITSHLLGGEFEDLVRYADRALTDGCRLQVAPRVTARRPRIPLRFASHTRQRRERSTSGARAPRCRSQDWRRCTHAPQHELELPKLEENVFDPVPQFVVQCVGQIGWRCPRELAGRSAPSMKSRGAGVKSEARSRLEGHGNPRSRWDDPFDCIPAATTPPSTGADSHRPRAISDPDR
jgi:hypothetical protein